MPINLTQLRKMLLQTDRDGLLQSLDAALNVMSEAQIEEVFGATYHEQIIQPMNPVEVLRRVQQFHADSLARTYYAPFNMNSKNYQWVPPETEDWLGEISTWLDRSCELVEEGHPPHARQCLPLLIELIDKINEGEEIVFAHEVGDWMIHAQQDYRAIYQQLSSSF